MELLTAINSISLIIIKKKKNDEEANEKWNNNLGIIWKKKIICNLMNRTTIRFHYEISIVKYISWWLYVPTCKISR